VLIFSVQGRPVSQCVHCRTLRKARSAHVRCDCGGEKAHPKGNCAQDVDTQRRPFSHLRGEQRLLIIDVADNCGCSHGARCTCALKKDHLDPVRESDSDEPSSLSVEGRPRAHTAHSESGLTIFTNGHHKPGHKHNMMAHKCGLPYVVPRTHPIHGSSPTGLANRSVDNLLRTDTIDTLHSESRIKDSMAGAQHEPRMVKSEHGSPTQCPTTNLEYLNGLLPPLDLSHATNDYNFMSNMDSFTSIPDQDQPIFSAALSAASIDWSHYGLGFNSPGDNFAPSYSQAPSFNGIDFTSIDQPALTTTSTSGEISEVEDFGSLNEIGANRPSLLSQQYGSDFDASDFGGEADTYRLSTASSYIGMPQVQMLASDVAAIDMEAFLDGVVQSSDQGAYGTNWAPAQSFADDIKPAQTPSSFDDNIPFPLLSAEEESRAFWMADFPPNNIPINHSHDGLSEENGWAR
jgi:hypothetical protein